MQRRGQNFSFTKAMSQKLQVTNNSLRFFADSLAVARDLFGWRYWMAVS